MNRRHSPYGAEIVVGVDGSPGCRRAVEFAAREAVFRDADLVAVMAVAGGAGAGSSTGPETGRIEAAGHRLRQFLQSVGTGGADVTLVVTTLPPADALIDRSRFAELLVLGATAGSVTTPGSISGRCLAEATCPVAVVRPRKQQRKQQRRSADGARHATRRRLVGQT